VLALVFAGVGLGASVGPLLTAVLWKTHHILGVSVAGTVCLLLAMILVGQFLRETPADELNAPQ
jgi:hypothetical protein